MKHNEMLTDLESFWGFYLGRPFRMNAGDISVPKPASTLGPEKEGIWNAYGLQKPTRTLATGIRNPTELICRQFVVLWEMVSPVGHILCVSVAHLPKYSIANIFLQIRLLGHISSRFAKNMLSSNRRSLRLESQSSFEFGDKFRR